jgi:hopene-associated glycosyltransferase HpnB
MFMAAIAAIPVAIWLYLLLGRGAFWRSLERDDGEPARPPSWPSVAVVIPARDEAAGIAQSIGSLLRQDYPGEWSVFLVDDDSNDGTAAVARSAAAGAAQGRLRILGGAPLPMGWTGKLWALKQGIEAAQRATTPPDYLLLTDADIVYQQGVLTRLVALAHARGSVLTSLMVKLRCESLAERMLIPAFIFFFQMLFPFSWVNRTGDRTAAAAGGCMLVRTDALQQAGGIESIRGALIDDCALARLMKARGPIWLGLTERVHSIRPYPDIAEIRRMVSRTAYAQLGYSPLLLAGTVAGMALTYLAPPLLAVFAGGPAQWLGIVAWLLMSLSFQPTLRLYGMSPLWGLALPAIALCYTLFTLDSALQYARGKGGLWKGRIQAT